MRIPKSLPSIDGTYIHILYTFSLVLFVLFSNSTIAQQKAFPTAYGGGAYASGGRGGNVYHVTSLEDNGSVGTLRWALGQPRPSTIIFDVSGTIDISNWLTLSGSDVTIAGQSAPVGGITIASTNGSRFRGQDINNFIIRYLRIRPATESSDDAFEFYGNTGGAYNIIMDHISASYGGDETLSLRGASTHDITYQRLLLAEGKTGSLFGDSSTPANSYDNSYLNSLFFNISHRTPNAASNSRIDIINNVTHDWQYRMSFVTGAIQLNHVNNYYSMGSRTDLAGGSQIQLNPLNSSNNNRIYTAGNIIDKGQFENPNADNKALWVEFQSGQQTTYAPSSEFVNTQYPLIGEPLPIQSAFEAYQDVISNVGANASLNADGSVTFHTDMQDTFYLDIMSQGEGANHPYEMYGNVRSWWEEQMYADFQASISSTPINTRPANFYVSNPHIPEVWFQANVPQGEDHNDISPSGYTWLEVYLNQVDTGTSSSSVNAGEDQNICEGETATLSASGADSYVWNTGQTTASIDVTPTATTTYTVTGTDSEGSETTDDVTVFVNPFPNANAGQDQTICDGESTTLSASGGDAYVWNTGQTTQNITVNPNTTTTYSVTVTTNGCESSDDVIVNVNPSPNADAGNDVTINQGESTTLSVTGTGTYLWSTGETTQSIIVNPTSDTTYNVTVSDNGCEASDSITVFVIEEANANAGDDVTICEGESTTLTASGGVDYLWSTGETTQSITVNPITDTVYTVTASNSFSSDTDDVTVFVNASPTANAGNDQTICEGETVTLSAQGGGTYLWSTGETTQSITVTPNTTTLYSVSVFQNNCEDSDDVTVFVNPTPNADAGPNIYLLDGASTVLTASGGGTYVWSTGETTESITVSPSVTTTYTVTVDLNGCIDSDQVTVTVNDGVIAYAGEDVTICEGESTTLMGSGGSDYTWSTGETTQSITVSPTVTTTYTVTAAHGTETDTDEVTVFVNPVPIANAGNNVDITIGESTTLTASGGDSYEWSTGETTQSITVSPSATTTYTVFVYLNGCEDFDEVTVTVNDTVNANAGDDVTICEGENTVLTATGGTNYVWSTGETTQSITVSPASTTNYSVTVSSGNSSDTDNVTVFVNPVPIANAGNNVNINAGESTTLVASGGDSYEWSTGATTASIVVSPNTTTIYTVFVYLNGCEDFDEVTVTVNDSETVNANAGDDVTMCQGDSTTLTASGGTEYLWSTGETTASITVSPTSTSNYTVIVSNGSNSDTDEVTVFVNPLPNVQVTGDVTILEGDFVTLSATGGNSYLWNNGATQPNIAVSPDITTTYSVTGYINNCSDTEDVTVSVLEVVNANAGDDETICSGESITLFATGGEDYLWNNGETTQSITVSPSESTMYTVIVSNALDSDADEVMVTVEDCDIVLPGEEPEYTYQLYTDRFNPTIIIAKLSGIEGPSKIHVHDVAGKLIYTEFVQDNNGQPVEVPINTSFYSKGIYVFSLEEQDKITPKKIVIR